MWVASVFNPNPDSLLNHLCIGGIGNLRKRFHTLATTRIYHFLILVGCSLERLTGVLNFTKGT
jgi:hypothetical protein